MTNYMEEILDMKLAEVLQLIHGRVICTKNHYLGIRTYRSPMDTWVYQQIIWETKPDVLIEIGNKWGGSTLMFSHIIQSAGLNTRIIGVDKDHSILSERVREIPNSVFIEGDAVKSFDLVENLIKPGEKVMIMDDSSHMYNITLAILKKYHKLVTKGQYFIIEDGIGNNGLPKKNRGYNAYKACEDFVKECREFRIDRSRELFVLTYNPKGYLLRIKE